MNLYNSYCYADLQAVADQIQSHVFIGNSHTVQSVTVNGSSIDISLRFKNNYYNHTVTPPVCTELGFSSSYSGLTISDATELWGLCLVVMASAFAVKVIKRAL